MADIVKDTNGREIEIRVLDPDEMLDLLEAAGDASTNQGYMRYAMVAASVSKIDGVPVLMPDTKTELKAVAKKLGNAGMVAVSDFLFKKPEAEISDKETAKN